MPTAKGEHGFQHYAQLRVAERSVLRAWVDHRTKCLRLSPPPPRRRAPKRWETWATRDAWVERAAQVDREDAARQREAFVKLGIERSAAHQRGAQGIQQILLAPVRPILETLAHPSTLVALRDAALASPAGFTTLLRLAFEAARVWPSIVQSERLALGLPTDSVEIAEPINWSFADSVARDPLATQMAIALLDRVCESSAPPDAALRAADAAARSFTR